MRHEFDLGTVICDIGSIECNGGSVFQRPMYARPSQQTLPWGLCGLLFERADKAKGGERGNPLWPSLSSPLPLPPTCAFFSPSSQYPRGLKAKNERNPWTEALVSQASVCCETRGSWTDNEWKHPVLLLSKVVTRTFDRKSLSGTIGWHLIETDWCDKQTVNFDWFLVTPKFGEQRQCPFFEGMWKIFFLYILNYLFTKPNLEEREGFTNIRFKTKEIKKIEILDFVVVVPLLLGRRALSGLVWISFR